MRLAAAFAVLSLVATSACAAAPMAPPAQIAGKPRVETVVTRDGDLWTVDYAFDRDVPAWAFFQSALLRETRQPWRPAWWSVQTPGVVLDRQGDRDVLHTLDGSPVPRTVRIVMRPQPGDLEAEYDPALIFTDGAVALYSGQFDVIPMPSVAAARALPVDLNGVDVPGGPSVVTWRDRAGPVLFKGQRVAAPTAEDAKTYVLFGEAAVKGGRGVTTVIDPGLPHWLGDELAQFTPRVMDFYAQRVGPHGGDQPTLMVSWTGPTQHLSSMGGSVLPGLISMNFEGEGVLGPDKAALDRAHWFIGHESAHFWMGSNGLEYEFARDAWITEGGADLMAVRAIAAIDPTYDARAELQTEVDDCVRLAAGQPVATAYQRGDHRAYYACGAVWGLVIEAAQRARMGGDYFDVVRGFKDGPVGADGKLTRDEWLTQLTRLSGDPTLAIDIARMLDDGVANPSAVLARLFERSGVAYRLDAGRVVLN
ncbi:hypothetical protein ASG17_06155 [Brevundimonas sp. Leaf363]|uniref:hypothetical protein n=1 Tax=Brevundimonas sp. Leaf363 TaxID=1736353 RepID=UPI0006F64E30|nr:hypothetical protein [Brevundimonas sp. Leaf363]KQS55648.1 hypothetical protein ASG17_06155 [Brevundimonas sp. Leaf363]